MQPYSQFRPTAFDIKGLGLNDHQEWLVHPCGTNRDADALTRSNFRVAGKDLQDVDPEGLHHEVYRFGHWACGWFEILVVRPGSPCAEVSAKHEKDLENYPVLDEDDWSEEEFSEGSAAE